MGGLTDAITPAKADGGEEKPIEFLQRIFINGRSGETVDFDPPGVTPTKFRIEPLDEGENDDAIAAAYNYTAKRLTKVIGRIEDTDLYKERLILEVLVRSVKRPENPFRDENVVRYYPAAAGADSYRKLTDVQLAYLYNLYQIVRAKFSPNNIRVLAATDIGELANLCASAAKESGDAFLPLASLDYGELAVIATEALVALSEFLASLQTQSSSPDSSQSTPETSNGGTTSSSSSPLDSSNLLSHSKALQQVVADQLSSTSSEHSNAVPAETEPTHEPDGETAAKDLAEQLSD